MMKRKTAVLLIVAVVVVVLGAYFGGLLAIRHPAPSVSWTAQNVGGLKYQFNASVFRIDGPLNWTFTFNVGAKTLSTQSGVTSNCSNPCQFSVTFDYSALGAGTYTVGLDVTDQFGTDSGLVTQDLTVVKIVPLSGTFLAAVVSGYNVTTEVLPAGGQPPYYVGFDYGDGVTVSVDKANAQGYFVHTHPYLKKGTYTIKATVWDSSNGLNNHIDLAPQTVTTLVQPNFPVPPDQSTSPPPVSGAAPLTATQIVGIALAVAGVIAFVVANIKNRWHFSINGAILVVVGLVVAFLL